MSGPEFMRVSEFLIGWPALGSVVAVSRSGDVADCDVAGPGLRLHRVTSFVAIVGQVAAGASSRVL